jgi:hypothetical protein
MFLIVGDFNMVKINIGYDDNVKKEYVVCEGHAEDEVRCAMLTAINVSVINYMRQVCNGVGFEAEIDYGYCHMYFDYLNEDGAIIKDMYEYSLQQLAESHPKSFKVIKDE